VDISVSLTITFPLAMIAALDQLQEDGLLEMNEIKLNEVKEDD